MFDPDVQINPMRDHFKYRGMNNDLEMVSKSIMIKKRRVFLLPHNILSRS
jgi:hypothetical protein